MAEDDDKTLSIHERLQIVYQRLDDMPPATSADEAFSLSARPSTGLRTSTAGWRRTPTRG
jgi:hypothetical protein